MHTLFKLVPSPDWDYLAVLTLEGEVVYLDPNNNKVIDRIDFNTSKELPGGERVRQENCVINLGFCFDFVEPKKKSPKKWLNLRKFKKNASVMAVNDASFCEYLFTDHCKTYQKHLDSVWENLLILQNYR